LQLAKNFTTTTSITVSHSGGSETRLALTISESKRNGHHEHQPTDGTDEIQTFGIVILSSLDKISRKMLLTKEGEDDPSVLPTILIGHVQLRYIFITDLSSMTD